MKNRRPKTKSTTVDRTNVTHCHTQHKDRQGTDDSPYSLPLKSAVLLETFGLSSLLFILHIGYKAVAGLLDGFLKGFRRAFFRIILHQCGG